MKNAQRESMALCEVIFIPRIIKTNIYSQFFSSTNLASSHLLFYVGPAVPFSILRVSLDKSFKIHIS